MSAHEISPGAHDSAAETACLSRSEWIRRCCAEATTALIDAAGHDLADARHQLSAVNQPGQRRSPEASCWVSRYTTHRYIESVTLLIMVS